MEPRPSGMRADEPSYTASRRASTRCLRELERLTADIISGAKALQGQCGDYKAVIRQSPNRTIVQLGGVALTVAWLQSPLGSVADGELLVILWNGDVAPSAAGRSDNTAFVPVMRSATPIWEGVLVVVAENDGDWRWRERNATEIGFTSTELAAHCIERLQHAFAARANTTAPSAS